MSSKPFFNSSEGIETNTAMPRRVVWLAALALLLAALPRVALAASGAAGTSPAAPATKSAAASASPLPGAAGTAPAAAGTDKGWAARKESDPNTDLIYEVVSRSGFSLKYPDTWKPDTGAKDFDPNTNFTLVSPETSYVQFTILPRASDPSKILSDTVKKLDGPAIVTLSRSKIDEWGSHKGQGYHLKGKIVGSFPGGIKVFVFSSVHFNVLIIEYYFSDELKDVQDDFQYISDNFKMND